MVLGGRPPGRVGHCQGAFLFNILMLFSSEYESCIILIADSVDGHAWCVSRFYKRGVWGVLIDRWSFCCFFFLDNYLRPSLHIGRFSFIGTFHAGRRWLVLASVNLRNGESQDSLLKRFRKKVVKSGVLSTVRRKRWFVSKSEQRRMEKKKAIRRIKRRTFTRETE